MTLRKTIAVVGFSTLALLATACGKDGTPDSDKGGSAAPQQSANTSVDLSASSPTWKKAKDRGYLVVGAKEDQPFLGYMDPATKERSGFDIEIARLVSAELGLDPKKIEFKTIASVNRETALQKGDVDIYVGTYSITDKRKESVDFAGPYYISGQSLLVQKNNTAITGKDTIKGKKVCSAKGSTPIQKIKTEFPETTPIEYDNYSLCVDNLLSGQVDAVTTDEAILKGYAAKDPEHLKVVGDNFSTEKYGIGLPKGDAGLRNKVDDILTAKMADGTWKSIYDATLGKSGSPAPNPPAVERY
ncbi:MAG: glutamate ABC transporter substrate-binding protein [Streptomycetaceae bacterium]|jgi:glutamate transport system substrate-binding protein|uniref:Glutamate ABC transporter substrate-binding protein n=1 Tax=Yinghuangia aomiensis TaxID=676205 RepID=A0ABP9H2C3_9ACTN|nr:glutamate ABC transporter substrate-binding protein [Streptomycetaceae bacterium]NUS53977.1 glutamate ABC transporter substrate-binding protein [Streptomycetaceae bacterium]